MDWSRLPEKTRDPPDPLFPPRSAEAKFKDCYAGKLTLQLPCIASRFFSSGNITASKPACENWIALCMTDRPVVLFDSFAKSIWTRQSKFAKVLARLDIESSDDLNQRRRMRFFIAACVSCLLVATIGCMTNNWSSAPFSKPGEASSDSKEKTKPNNFWNSRFGEMSGLDERSREIEKRLGY